MSPTETLTEIIGRRRERNWYWYSEQGSATFRAKLELKDSHPTGGYWPSTESKTIQ